MRFSLEVDGKEMGTVDVKLRITKARHYFGERSNRRDFKCEVHKGIVLNRNLKISSKQQHEGHNTLNHVVLLNHKIKAITRLHAYLV